VQNAHCTTHNAIRNNNIVEARGGKEGKTGWKGRRRGWEGLHTASAPLTWAQRAARRRQEDHSCICDDGSEGKKEKSRRRRRRGERMRRGEGLRAAGAPLTWPGGASAASDMAGNVHKCRQGRARAGGGQGEGEESVKVEEEKDSAAEMKRGGAHHRRDLPALRQ